MSTAATLAVDWGPVAVWVSAFATFLAVLVAALVALGYFDRLRGPRIHVTFADTEPWCRRGATVRGRAASGSASASRTVEPAQRGDASDDSSASRPTATCDPTSIPCSCAGPGLPRFRAFDPFHSHRCMPATQVGPWGQAATTS